MRNHFGWIIRQGKQTIREGWMTYATFEDARIAGKMFSTGRLLIGSINQV